MKGKTITRWGKYRWQIAVRPRAVVRRKGTRTKTEGFFKTAKHQFSLHRFGQKTLLGVYRWLILSFLSYMECLLGLFTQWEF
ncbi:hypothetical protein [Crocosphaera sp.]|uniref:hypothetical protein n=1 Tax=Crocosphaera sp. TaxID=2729996 RepID=UPI003F23B44D|nr:hypothetical protein [Crocosphaera sp.]